MVTSVVQPPRLGPWLAGGLFLLAGLAGAPAQAQRQVVEDGWDEADVALARAQHPGLSGATQLATPRGRAPAPRVSTSRYGGLAERDAEVRWLEATVAWARSGTAGPLDLELRGPDGMDWLWLGHGDEPEPRWGFTRGPRLCAGRCRLKLPAGRYRFGLRSRSLHGAVAQPVRIETSGVLRARYESRNARRVAGIALVSLGGPVMAGTGGFMALVGLACDRHWACLGDLPIGLPVGLALGVLSFTVGLALILTAKRRLRLEFQPQLPGAGRRTR